MEKKGKEGGSRRPRLSDKRIDLWPSLPTALLEKLPDARQAEPAVQVVEPVTWLAGLESAGGGKVTIQWAMRPEVFFAAQEAQEGGADAAGAAQD